MISILGIIRIWHPSNVAMYWINLNSETWAIFPGFISVKIPSNPIRHLPYRIYNFGMFFLDTQRQAPYIRSPEKRVLIKTYIYISS